MSEKAKVGQRRPSPRGLGYLTVLLLVVAALIIGAGHVPLNEFVQSILSSSTPLPANTPVPTSNAEPALAFTSADGNGIVSIIHERTGITVLTVTVADSIRIEYLLAPPETKQVEVIHSNNMLQMICAIRQVGPTRRPIIFAGVGRFINDLDEELLRSRVETKLSTLSFNLIDCSYDIAANDVDWNSLSDYHRSFPKPEGLRVSE